MSRCGPSTFAIRHAIQFPSRQQNWNSPSNYFICTHTKLSLYSYICHSIGNTRVFVPKYNTNSTPHKNNVCTVFVLLLLIISPDVNILATNKQCQFSNSSSCFFYNGEQWINKRKGNDKWNAKKCVLFILLSSYYKTMTYYEWLVSYFVRLTQNV